jgi:hypothetical protein
VRVPDADLGEGLGPLRQAGQLRLQREARRAGDRAFCLDGLPELPDRLVNQIVAVVVEGHGQLDGIQQFQDGSPSPLRFGTLLLLGCVASVPARKQIQFVQVLHGSSSSIGFFRS